jgi:hypothetical protein
LLRIVDKFLEESNSITLKLTKCHLLNKLGYRNHSLHEVLQLRQQKLLFMDEFSLWEFGNDWRLKNGESGPTSNLVELFHYQKEIGNFEELMEECAQNNGEYWEELVETAPSLPKLRKLASNYILYKEAIASCYDKIMSVVPEACLPTATYLHFLLQVGVEVREAIKVRDELICRLESEISHQTSLGGLVSHETCMIAVDTVGCRLGSVTNCNSHTKVMLGFDKNAILGKNITKIMPKIYTDLHDDFLLS